MRGSRENTRRDFSGPGFHPASPLQTQGQASISPTYQDSPVYGRKDPIQRVVDDFKAQCRLDNISGKIKPSVLLGAFKINLSHKAPEQVSTADLLTHPPQQALLHRESMDFVQNS